MARSETPSRFERWQAAVSGRCALYPSTISYIAWALLYALLLVFGWFHAGVPRLFAGILLADVIINIVSPFIIGAGGFLAALLLKRGVRVPWGAYPFLLLAFLLGIAVPVAVLFRFGGWLLLAGAFLFFMRVNWMYMERGADRWTVHLLVRGLVGPFAFFAPALVISCLYVGRNTLGLENRDWVPLFGVIYFGIQAGFEEFMLRRSARGKSLGEPPEPPGSRLNNEL
jgi:hypothetical protein